MRLSEILCLLICLTLFARTLGDTTVSDIATFDEEKCSKARKDCCNTINTLKDKETMECILMLKDTLPPDETNLNKNLDFLSCYTHCIYKKRNYLVKGDEDINMQAVKEHLEKSYVDRPKELQYYMELYEYCRKKAFSLYTSAENKVRKGCKSYYMYVYLCQIDYHMQTTCPYFVWGAKKGTSTSQECKAARDQCYKIDGLTPREEFIYVP